MKQIGELFGKPVFTGRDVQRTFKKEDYIYLPSDKIEDIKKAGIISPGESIPVIDEDDLTKQEYVDLGLPSGTLWCSHNLGAEKPCDYGDFYAWGEIEPKEVYSWSTYKYGSAWNKITKYNKFNSSYGIIDNKTVLDPEDDAVYVATDGNAHMPTIEQIDELRSQTISQWCQCTVLGDDHITHDVTGRLFTSKTNGNKIFIPAAGYQDGSNLNDRGDCFNVWSASLNEGSAGYSWLLGSNSDDVYKVANSRYNGRSVRGVQNLI